MKYNVVCLLVLYSAQLAMDLGDSGPFFCQVQLFSNLNVLKLHSYLAAALQEGPASHHYSTLSC